MPAPSEHLLFIQGERDPPREQIGTQLGEQGSSQEIKGQVLEQLKPFDFVQVSTHPLAHTVVSFWERLLLHADEAQTGRQEDGLVG